MHVLQPKQSHRASAHRRTSFFFVILVGRACMSAQCIDYEICIERLMQAPNTKRRQWEIRMFRMRAA